MIQVKKGTSGKVVCGAASILAAPVTQQTRESLCQVKSSQVKSSQVKILAAVWGLALLSAAAQAQVTTTETLNFDDNLMPGGWGFYDLGAPGHNLQITNQRLEIGQVDTYGGIARAFNASGVSQVRIEYDGNIANVYWGQGSAAMLAHDALNWSAGAVNATMRKVGYGQNVMEFDIGRYSSTLPGGGTNYYANTMAAVFGNYHMNALFEDGQISQTVTNLDTGASFSSGVVAIPGFLLSDMNNVLLFGVTTTGTSAWIDNASISITTAVPEPESYALLLAGLGVLGAVRRRQLSHTVRA